MAAEKKKSNLLKSFKFAFEGIHAAIQTETNWKIGLIEAIFVLILGFYFDISRYDWIIVSLMIGLVLTSELINSAMEAIVDSFTSQEHPGAKKAKDFAAGAVVIIIITAAVVGSLVFIPYLTHKL